MIEKQDIFPIAIGTFGLGADRFETWSDENSVDVEKQENDLNALMYSYGRGQNYIDTSYIYAGGITMRFLKKFFDQIPRNKIFVSVKIENYIEKVSDIEEQLDKYLALMGLDYADTILLHTPVVSKIPLETAYHEMQRLVDIGKSRYISISNLSLEQLRFMVEECGIKPFSFEGLYNLECKINEDAGIIEYCRNNSILFINYQPFRRNRTANHNYPLLIELAKKYSKTQNQILLNWMIKEKGLHPITKASSREDIDLNLDTLKFMIDANDMQKLNDFRSADLDSLKVDWDNKGGIPVWKLANQLEQVHG